MSEGLVRVAPVREVEILARMEDARRELAAACNISEAKHIADAAATICEWLRRQSAVGLEIVNDGLLLKLEAEARMGEFLSQPGAVATRGRPEKTSGSLTFSAPTHRELGINREAARQYRKIAWVPPELLRRLAAEATARGRELTREAVLKLAKRRPSGDEETAGERQLEPFPRVDFPAEWRDRILTGDARELAAGLPDNSVALCICDPVWERSADYQWLAAECERVLIPGGCLVVQCGNLRRFETELALRASGLSYVDLIAEVYPFALTPLRNIRVQVGWKPHYWFSKGPRRDLNGRNLIAAEYRGADSGWLMNRVHAKGKRSADGAKDLHDWGDAEEFARGVAERLCGPAELVWDPFCGSGTVPVVCRRLGLPFVAMEIDPEAAALARDRLRGITRAVSPQQLLWVEDPHSATDNHRVPQKTTESHNSGET